MKVPYIWIKELIENDINKKDQANGLLDVRIENIQCVVHIKLSNVSVSNRLSSFHIEIITGFGNSFSIFSCFMLGYLSFE